MSEKIITDDLGLKWLIREKSKRGKLTQDYLGPNQREEYNFDIIKQHSSQKNIFIDVGANVGGFSVKMARYFRKVYAYEPQPFNFEGLKRNIELNEIENVVAHNIAVGNKHQAKVSMDNFGGGAKIKDYAGDITMIRLDDVFFAEGVSIIKIDTEGHEEQVIRGAFKLINEQKPLLLIETHTKEVPNQMERLEELFEELNYEYKILAEYNNDYHLLVKPKV